LSKSAVDVIGAAFEHTQTQLTKPFRFGQWARLAVLALATGEMSSGGGCNGFKSMGNLPSRFPAHPQNFAGSHDALGRLGLDPAVLATIIVVALVGFLILGLVWVYVASISRFVLFEAVLRKHCELGTGWNRWQGQGLRFFGWQLALSVVALGVAAVLFLPLLLPVLATMWKNQEPGPALLLAFLPMIAVFVVFGLVMLLIVVLAKDFVIPLMAVDNLGVMESWTRLLRMMSAEKLGYAGYIGMKMVLAIGAALVFNILGLIAAVVVMVPVAIVGAILVILAKGAGLGWNAFTITAAIVAGTLVLAGLLYVIALVCVPVAVFFPAYAMYFFAERYPALHALLHPPPPAAPTPPVPPLSPAASPVG
jgi:hypothetical protein